MRRAGLRSAEGRADPRARGIAPLSGRTAGGQSRARSAPPACVGSHATGALQSPPCDTTSPCRQKSGRLWESAWIRIDRLGGGGDAFVRGADTTPLAAAGVCARGPGEGGGAQGKKGGGGGGVG